MAIEFNSGRMTVSAEVHLRMFELLELGESWLEDQDTRHVKSRVSWERVRAKRARLEQDNQYSSDYFSVEELDTIALQAMAELGLKTPDERIDRVEQAAEDLPKSLRCESVRTIDDTGNAVWFVNVQSSRAMGSRGVYLSCPPEVGERIHVDDETYVVKSVAQSPDRQLVVTIDRVPRRGAHRTQARSTLQPATTQDSVTSGGLA